MFNKLNKLNHDGTFIRNLNIYHFIIRMIYKNITQKLPTILEYLNMIILYIHLLPIDKRQEIVCVKTLIYVIVV